MSDSAVRAVRVFRIDRLMALAGACVLVELGVVILGRTAGSLPATLVSCAASVFGWVALGVRRRWPVWVAVTTLATTLLYYQASGVNGPAPALMFMVALYTVAGVGQLAAVVTLAVVIMLVIGYGEFTIAGEQRDIDNMSIALLSGWFLSVIAFSHAMRSRQAYLAEAEQRALAAERERDVRARQSATEERLRIARELHDVLGHNISLINIQTTAALHRSTKRPGETAELLAALEFTRDTSKEALRELRSTLGVLRQVDEQAPTAPAAGLDRVVELADRAAGITGLKVSVESEGETPVVPPGISLAAYRIIQESLTNVTRHAGAAHATIAITYHPGELRVCVEDDGRGAPETVRGGGITGMTERARALGGELTAENTGHGFRVSARLPMPAGTGPTTAY
ncbi:sensor histidine kinase [Streptomyces sp. NPDC057137]|uniref:sensor histidine kinase n=1 Tax=Streptomyces sp. NPDC057137 TaxID=3346030 RepID=UPI00363A99C1